MVGQRSCGGGAMGRLWHVLLGSNVFSVRVRAAVEKGIRREDMYRAECRVENPLRFMPILGY